jgi:hypothetical protein
VEVTARRFSDPAVVREDGGGSGVAQFDEVLREALSEHLARLGETDAIRMWKEGDDDGQDRCRVGLTLQGETFIDKR